VRLIASVDHVNAATLWDSGRAAAFSWVWEEVHSGLPHLAEVTDGDALAHLIGHQGGARGAAQQLSQAASARAVLAALNPAAKKVFRELATHALAARPALAMAGTAGTSNKHGRGRTSAAEAEQRATNAADAKVAAAAMKGYSFHELMDKCRLLCIASNEAALRRHLAEFIDHKLVTQERGSGTERYVVALPDAILKELLAGVLARL